MAAGVTYESLATTTLNTPTSSVTFSSISGSYTDLVLVINVKMTTGAQGTVMQVNNDTGSNYSRLFMAGNGSSAFSAKNVNYNYFDPLYFGTEPSLAIVNLMDYSNTTTFKTFLSRGNGLEVGGVVGLWRSTSAINTIKLTPSSGNYDTGSTFTIYGIAAA